MGRHVDDSGPGLRGRTAATGRGFGGYPISLPDNFSGQMNKLLVTLANSVPVTGMPVAILATIESTQDKDGDGVGDLDQILSPSRDLVLALPNVGVDWQLPRGGRALHARRWPIPAGAGYRLHGQQPEDPLWGRERPKCRFDLNLVPTFGAAPSDAPGLPKLSVESTPGNALLISWPATATGFQLQQAGDTVADLEQCQRAGQAAGQPLPSNHR